jgi:hypothetical protein
MAVSNDIDAGFGSFLSKLLQFFQQCVGTRKPICVAVVEATLE